MQIKAIFRSHPASRMVKLGIQTTTDSGVDVREGELLELIGASVQRLLKELEIELPYDPAWAYSQRTLCHPTEICVHCSSSHNSWEMESTGTSINW